MAFAVAKSASRALSVRRASRARSTSRVVCAASDRTLWLPAIPAPPHLDGSLPGDFGFDPLGLGQDPERLKWYVEGEKTNGRWAMMAVLGIMGQELLGVEPKWFEAGAKEYDIPPLPLTAIEFLVIGFLETKRWQGFKETGSSGLINSFPFDPAGMNSPDMAVKEIKNGRLAMVAFIGFSVQALVTRTGPIEGLTAHLSSPFDHNFVWYLNNLPSVVGN
jgi:light-harvesting complex I chlorophyll a/b binding protein 5